MLIYNFAKNLISFIWCHGRHLIAVLWLRLTTIVLRWLWTTIVLMSSSSVYRWYWSLQPWTLLLRIANSISSVVGLLRWHLLVLIHILRLLLILIWRILLILGRLLVILLLLIKILRLIILLLIVLHRRNTLCVVVTNNLRLLINYIILVGNLFRGSSVATRWWCVLLFFSRGNGFHHCWISILTSCFNFLSYSSSLFFKLHWFALYFLLHLLFHHLFHHTKTYRTFLLLLLCWRCILQTLLLDSSSILFLHLLVLRRPSILHLLILRSHRWSIWVLVLIITLLVGWWLVLTPNITNIIWWNICCSLRTFICGHQ